MALLYQRTVTKIYFRHLRKSTCFKNLWCNSAMRLQSPVYNTDECHLTGNSHITAARRTGEQKEIHWLCNDPSFTLDGGKTLYVIAYCVMFQVSKDFLWVTANECSSIHNEK